MMRLPSCSTPVRILFCAAFTATAYAALAGCATVPRVEQRGEISAPGPAPEIVGARGPLSARQSRMLLDRITKDANAEGMLARHLAIEQAVAETPLVAGNVTRVLTDGRETFPAMFAAIKSAKRHIDLEYYILEDIELNGEHLGDLLIAKRQEGVAINIIYDSFGSNGTPIAFFERLKNAGINLVAFNPVNPLDPDTSNMRDHRKLLLVDGQEAIVGGVNLSATYESSSLAKSGGVDGEPWHDTDLEIEGPVVAQLQAYFLEHWKEQNGPPLADEDSFPQASSKGNEVVRIVASTPENAIPRYYVTLLSAIRNAEKSIFLTAAYFVPTEQEKDDLVAAARRGVDVRLLLPGDSDSGLALAVGHSNYGDLLEAGVKIYETQKMVLHSKTVVIDGVWSVVGSSNFDRRSVLFNDEIDAVVLGSKTAQQLQNLFERDIRNARQIDAKTWRDRPLTARLGELFARVWENLL